MPNTRFFIPGFLNASFPWCLACSSVGWTGRTKDWGAFCALAVTGTDDDDEYAGFDCGASGDSGIPCGASGDSWIPCGASGDSGIPCGASGDSGICGASGGTGIPCGAGPGGVITPLDGTLSSLFWFWTDGSSGLASGALNISLHLNDKIWQLCVWIP